jgi:hypothetical protein
MKNVSPTHSVIVLGNPRTRLGRFVKTNLRLANIEEYFVESTEEFRSASLNVDSSRLILIGPEWDFMLLISCRDTPLFFVKREGQDWGPPWASVEFEVRDPDADGDLFQQQIVAFLRGELIGPPRTDAYRFERLQFWVSEEIDQETEVR